LNVSTPSPVGISKTPPVSPRKKKKEQRAPRPPEEKVEKRPPPTGGGGGIGGCPGLLSGVGPPIHANQKKQPPQNESNEKTWHPIGEKKKRLAGLPSFKGGKKKGPAGPRKKPFGKRGVPLESLGKKKKGAKTRKRTEEERNNPGGGKGFSPSKPKITTARPP